MGYGQRSFRTFRVNEASLWANRLNIAIFGSEFQQTLLNGARGTRHSRLKSLLRVYRGRSLARPNNLQSETSGKSSRSSGPATMPHKCSAPLVTLQLWPKLLPQSSRAHTARYFAESSSHLYRIYVHCNPVESRVVIICTTCFAIKKLCILPIQWMYLFHVVLTITLYNVV